MMRLRSLSGPELTRFLKFSVVGTVGAVVDFGTFNLLHTRLAVPAVPASVLSFTAAVVSNFIWNRYWTYPDSRSKPIRRQAAQFTMVSLIGLAIRTPLFAFLLGPCTRLAAGLLDLPALSGSALQASTLGGNLALAAAVVVVLFWNFFANRYWTYADVDAATPAAGETRQLESPPV
ncbi:MAG TPA: GtrA family protein [Anaerolineales bacterium]|nr:GtrA family protein [Anaerolineales bacterium]